ncbi:MAG: 2-C-methyl-D-erythritol 4-phosphate cytidylyltransferase [Melioribacteraceae bacterium]|nr:2-C-methyl-D-erythritol 4-phosphate cytidylyltransferase [Melioribacteraceae bacterium]MDD3559215.1 2-C-methyl-D-erythritol 4-phosphate cytidylyltransferase [Melioribacteraceae bacterium]
MKTAAIIPAGGKGTRTDLEIPKQFYKVNGKELIVYTLEVFQRSLNIDEIIIAAIPNWIEKLYELSEKYSLTKVSKIIEGGITRQHSVYNALASRQFSDDDIIAVHDAARPLLSQSVLNRVIETAKIGGTAVTAINARDSLFKGDSSVKSYLDRENVFYAQTPQVFRFDILKDAFRKAKLDNFIGTDESMLVLRNGTAVKIVEGSTRNFKVTDREDLEIFESIVYRNKL